MSAFAASLVFAAAAVAGPTANPSVVTPTAEATSVLRVREAGMYRVDVSTDVDVDCRLSDALRGDFLSRSKRCAFDALLDPGVYKLALTFAGDSKSQTGRAKIDVNALIEDEVAPIRMDDGAHIEAILLEGHQRSFWLDVKNRDHVAFTVAGRTAGRVELWRNAQWIETGTINHSTRTLGDGRRVHHWEFARVLEPGQYKVVVYGTQPQVWAKAETRTRQNRLKVAATEDALFISRGAPLADARGRFEFEIPAWGFARFALPFKRTASALVLPKAPTGEVVLSAVSVRKSAPRFGGGNRCSIYKSNTVPACGARMTSGGDLTVLEVRGPPKTRGVIVAAKAPAGKPTDGTATSMTSNLDFDAPKAKEKSAAYFVGSFDLPPDDDAAPLSCALEELDSRGRPIALIATDEPSLSADIALARTFNYDQRKGAEIWFSVTDAETFSVATQGKLSSQCELFAIAPDGRSTRVASGVKPAKKSDSRRTDHCRISKFLSPGRYLLRLYNGRRGVENIRIGASAAKRTTAGRSSCQMAAVNLESGRRYRLRHSRTGRAQNRGLILRPLPLTLDAPLSLSVTKDRPLDLAVKSAGQVRLHSASNATFECGPAKGRRSRSRNGVCTTTLGANDRLLVTTEHPGTLPLFVENGRAPSTLRLKGPEPFRPKSAPSLPRLSADKEIFFDFDRRQERAFALDVPRAGLYELESTGLLAMECHVRTPTVLSLYSDKSGGRGRNCLLQGGLRPGQYLLKVRSVGQSKGRAGLVLRQRTPLRAPPLKVGAVRHQDIAAGSLVVTPLKVTAEDAGRPLNFSAAAAGGRSGECRLEDDDGWPIQSAPHRCVFTRTLPAGDYRWIQLPEPVATTRRVSVQPQARVEVIKPEVNAVTPLPLGALLTVSLGDQKEQRFVVEVPADLEVLLSLDNGMRGTLHTLLASGKQGTKVVDVGPMTARGSLPGAPFSASEILRQPLKAGAYLLTVRHSRDDVGITYQVGAAVRTLAPGVSFDVAATDNVAVEVPKDGYVRIRTEGMVDVRCRLFDDRDRLVAESSRVGADWNCGLVRRLTEGRYRLVLESEAGGQGRVNVSMTRPPTKALGALSSGSRLRASEETQTIFLAPTRGDVVEDVVLTSDAPLSCSLETPDGTALATKVDQTSCRLLAWPGPRPEGGAERQGLVVRVWQTAKSDGIRFQRTSRAVRPFTGGTLRADNAGLAIVENPGLFDTGDAVACLSATERGALRDCSGTTSLDKGPVVIAGLSRAPTAVALRERMRAAGTSVLDAPLSTQAFYERYQSESPSLHLATVTAPLGATAPPVCRLVGGVSHIDEGRCVTAVAQQTRSTLFAFAAETSPYSAEILRRSVVVPSATSLPRGVSSMGWRGEAVAYKLPDTSYRLRAFLAPQSWAVALDSRGRVAGVCNAPPSLKARPQGPTPLTPCRLRGRGGQLVLIGAPSAAAGRARVELVTLREPAKAALLLAPMQERIPGGPGTETFMIEPADSVREVHVDSHATFTCDLFRDDGVQQRGCHLTLPAGIGAKFHVDHDGRPFRARVHRPGWGKVAQFGQRLPKRLGAPLQQGDTLVVNATGLTDRTISVAQRAVVRVHSDSGVCALFSGRRTLAVDGLGGPCDLSYVADPGPLRVMVRPFGDAPNFGTVYVVKDAIVPLREGVGPSTWVAPGEERFFRFDVKSDAHVGVGLQRQSDAIECTLYDRHHRVVATGCQQYNFLKRGGYELGVQVQPGDPPLAIRPVILGTEGTDAEVPADVVEGFRAQAGGSP